MENLQTLTKDVHLWQHGKTFVFLLSGKAGVGKTFTSLIMKDILNINGLHYVEIDSFAKRVKEVGIDGFGWNRLKDSEGRKLLQDIGRIGREYNPTIWADYLYNKHFSGFPPDALVIDDWRFPNEINVFKDIPMIEPVTIRIDAEERESLKGTDLYNDVSEVSLDDYNFDWVIENHGDAKDLATSVREIIKRVLTK